MLVSEGKLLPYYSSVKQYKIIEAIPPVTGG